MLLWVWCVFVFICVLIVSCENVLYKSHYVLRLCECVDMFMMVDGVYIFHMVCSVVADMVDIRCYVLLLDRNNATEQRSLMLVRQNDHQPNSVKLDKYKHQYKPCLKYTRLNHSQAE
jgi:hypothetical protein